MKILVTGGAGFIGSQVVDTLLKKGEEVIVIDNLCTGYKKNINKLAKFYKKDIGNYKELREIFKLEKPDKVVHCAAQIKVGLSVKNPLLDFKSNSVGGLNVLECCKNYGIKKIVYLCTGGALYGEPEYNPADENHPINPVSPYGISKRSIELYLNHYHQDYNLNFVSLRFSNVYGPRDGPESDHVIPSFIYSILNNKSPQIYGDGRQGRDFIYVRDVVNAIILALNKNTKDKFLNIGTQKLVSIIDILKMIKKILGSRMEPKYVKKREGDVREIYLNIKKAKKELGWIPKTSLNEGLKETIQWFKKK